MEKIHENVHVFVLSLSTKALNMNVAGHIFHLVPTFAPSPLHHNGKGFIE